MNVSLLRYVYVQPFICGIGSSVLRLQIEHGCLFDVKVALHSHVEQYSNITRVILVVCLWIILIKRGKIYGSIL